MCAITVAINSYSPLIWWAVTVLVSVLDKEILTDYPHFPKFSIFKLCLKIWFSEMCSVLINDNCSILSKIKDNLIKLFEEYINNDLNSIIKSKNYSYNSTESTINSSNLKNNSDLFFSSNSKNFSLSTSISLFSSNDQSRASTFCPFNSYYEENFSLCSCSIGSNNYERYNRFVAM